MASNEPAALVVGLVAAYGLAMTLGVRIVGIFLVCHLDFFNEDEEGEEVNEDDAMTADLNKGEDERLGGARRRRRRRRPPSGPRADDWRR